MYIPSQFAVAEPNVLHELISHHPFGALITHGKGGLDANHIPFELVVDQGGFGVLQAHVARANPVWQEVADDDKVLVVFSAGNAYISPSWYPSKHAHHKQVPTWNYVVVHAHGRIRIRDDKKFVRSVIAKLTRTNEAQEEKPWKMGDAPPDYIEDLVGAIVGIEIEIARLVGKRKLSQNKEARDIQGAGDALIARNQPKIGDAMLACAAKNA
ncbi:FMN-binding negative transcriptional regulator [Caballeronia sp. DA-9]|uniref:FMN-binding negative transcriptional regulator n=1 Tax=Caballeronia sp. DA-9 TaxID=3436237 RepID=UPI003F66DCD9